MSLTVSLSLVLVPFSIWLLCHASISAALLSGWWPALPKNGLLGLARRLPCCCRGRCPACAGEPELLLPVADGPCCSGGPDHRVACWGSCSLGFLLGSLLGSPFVRDGSWRCCSCRAFRRFAARVQAGALSDSPLRLGRRSLRTSDIGGRLSRSWLACLQIVAGTGLLWQARSSRRRWPPWHRWLGTSWCLLVVLPSGCGSAACSSWLSTANRSGRCCSFHLNGWGWNSHAGLLLLPLVLEPVCEGAGPSRV